MIHIADSQTHQILDHISFKYLLSNNHHRSMQDNLETFDFETFADKSFSGYLEKQNRIIIPGEDEKLREFIIFEAGVNRINRQVEVYTEASYLGLKKAKVIDPHTTDALSAEAHAVIALAGTEFEPGNIKFNGVRTLTFDDDTNPYAYLKKVASELNLELDFRIEKENGFIAARYVDMVEQIGRRKGRTAELGRDLIELRRTEKTDKIVTALKVKGPEQDDGTRLEMIVEDKEALKRWGLVVNGNLQHLWDSYEPQSTDQNMTKERLTELGRNELNKRINAVVNYKGGIADLEHVKGMENKKLRFGDTIGIKDTSYEPHLYLEARIHAQDRDIVDESKKKVELGDYVEYTEEEVDAIWKSLQAEIKKKVSMTDVMEATYDKDTIDTKDVPGNEAKTKLDTDVGTGVIETILGAQGKADSAKQAAVTDSNAYTDANAVSQTDYNAKISAIESDILDKADQAWVEGELLAKEPNIPKQNSAPTSPAIDDLWWDTSTAPNILRRWDGTNWVKASPTTASEVGAYTVTEVDTALNAKVDSTTYNTDMDGVVTDISSNESRITQNETDITSKVSQTDYNSLEGRVGTAETSINQNATDITSKAEQTTVDALDGRVSTAESDITQNANAITSKVETTTFNNLEGRVDTAESTIIQHSNEIDLKVNEDGVIAAVNLTSETATINAENISLVGAVTVLSDITGNLGTINAGTINGVDINGSVLTATGTDGRVVINGNGWFVRDASGYIRVGISTSDQSWSPANPGFISFLNQWGNLFGSVGIDPQDRVNLQGVKRVYIGGGEGLEMSTQGILETLSVGNTVIQSTGGDIRLTAYNAVNIQGSNGPMRFNTTNEVRILAPDVTYGDYRPIFASSFDVKSSEVNKSNIMQWDGKGLDLINSSVIYEYDNDDSANNLGLVIERETPSEIVKYEEEGGPGSGIINLYAMASVSWKGIQELSVKQQVNADNINWLKMENKLLKARVTKLEGAA